MKIIDTHCDALLKLQIAKRKGRLLDFRQAKELDTNLERLKKGGVQVQFFAIFVDPDVPSDQKWQHALEQIDLFHTEIIDKNPEMKHIRNWEELDELKPNEIGAILALEGADAFGNDLVKLRHLYRMGVLYLGMTWNTANLCADGADEPRGGGLTELGKEVVRLNNKHRVFTDVSHSTINGFWDMLELAAYPIASHANARAICDHRRNLYDDQIEAMFAKGGLIHVVFNPPFINENSQKASIADLIKHIDHLCSLGGVNQIGFGSDFDGISTFVNRLEDAGKYQNLLNELLKRYSEDEVRGFAYQNFLDHRPQP
ncbi:MAG TPA: dipeptidase [Bacillota bacterium]|nr:dipeptidase [Bacillota bacterium]